jgi:hypothetical protein
MKGLIYLLIKKKTFIAILFYTAFTFGFFIWTSGLCCFGMIFSTSLIYSALKMFASEH